VLIAVWLKESYKNLPEDKLDLAIKYSKFDIKILTELQESLLPFLGQKVKKKSSSEGWFTDIQLHDFKDFIENSIEFLVKEEKVKEPTGEVKQRVNEFVLTLSSFDSKSQFAKIYYDLLWKLFGLSLGKDYVEIKEAVFGQVALSIVLSSEVRLENLIPYKLTFSPRCITSLRLSS